MSVIPTQLFPSKNVRLFYNDTFSLSIPCTIRERHTDYLTITDHPVELGAVVSDHAYLNPQLVDIEVAYGAGLVMSLNDIYKKFLDLQASRVQFSIITGKRAYQNMLIGSMETQTDSRSDNLLHLMMRCRQVIIVSTQVVPVSASKQANAPATAAPVKSGAVQTFPLADQSVITALPL